ncbi:CaiB/BaiF CoA transferase family protein [Chloroflexota bacterium]
MSGIKVVEFGNAIFAPLCASLLAIYGADVIKIEPPEGDMARLSAGRGDSILFLNRNQGKKSIAVDLRNPEGKEIILKLIREADIMVHNHRPQAIKKKGLDYESVAKINPRIIYAALSSYGDSGPFANLPGADPWTQAFTGMVASQGNPQDPPYLVGHPVCDNTGATLGAYGIMMALFMRERTGKGQEVSTSLVNAGIYLQQDAIAHYLIEGLNLTKGGRGHYRGLFPYGAYPAKDGDVVTFFGQDNDEWKVVCEIIGLDETLVDDPRYDTISKRQKARTELYPILDAAFRQKTRAEWQEAFRERHLRCDPCLDYAELVAHPQFQACDLLTEVEHPRDGKLTMVGSPVKLSSKEETDTRVLPAPVLGQHTVEILQSLGYTMKQVNKLIDDGVVNPPAEGMMSPGGQRTDTAQYASVTRTYKHRRAKRQ